MLDWRRRYGRLPSSYDWSRSHARRRRGEALERLAEGAWPAASVVSDVFGSWAAARAAASDPPRCVLPRGAPGAVLYLSGMDIEIAANGSIPRWDRTARDGTAWLGPSATRGCHRPGPESIGERGQGE
jgi:hypothetical protein